MRRATAILLLCFGCSPASGSESETSSACETPSLPERGAYERCSLTQECDNAMSCAYDSSTFGGSRVSVCEPECSVDDDCPAVPFEGNFGADSIDGLCTIGCASMGSCPQGMICAFANGASRCSWASGEAAACAQAE